MSAEIEKVAPEEIAYQAYNLRVAGKNWIDIAEQLGYSSPSEASRAVNSLISVARDSIGEERRSEIVYLELDRLDQLQAAVWTPALGGDLKSIDAVLKIMAHRARLLQLGETVEATTKTVIIAGESYLSSLKELADG